MTVTGCGAVCQLHMQQGAGDIVIGMVVLTGVLSAAHYGYKRFRRWRQ